jgi:hypothetical protein
LAAALPVATNPEHVRSITTRRGSSTKDPPYPKGAKRSVAIPLVFPSMVEKENNIPEEVPPEPIQDEEMR